MAVQNEHLFKIGNANMQGLSAPSKALLQFYLNRKKPHIFTLSETHLDDTVYMRFRDYTMIRKDRDRQGGGVAILVHKNLAYQQIDVQQQSTNEHITIHAHLTDNQSVYITSIYVRPRDYLDENLITTLLTRYKKHIILGDFNAHHENFGSTTTDAQGRHLDDIIVQHNLVMMNGKEHTLIHPHGTELVDYVLATLNVGSKLYKYEVDGFVGSDHIPSCTTISTSAVKTTSPPKEITVIRKLDTEAYKEELETTLQPPEHRLHNKEEIDTYIKYLTEKLNQATTNHTPTKIIRPGSWCPSPGTMKIIRKRRALIRNRNRQRNPPPDTQAEIIRLGEHIRLLVIYERQLQWRDLCTEDLSEFSTNSHQFWKTFKKLTNRSAQPNNHILEYQGTIAVTPQQKADLQVKFYQHRMTPINDNINQELTDDILHYNLQHTSDFNITEVIENNEPQLPQHPLIREITEQEIMQYAKKLPNKTPGPDNIHNAALKYAPKKFTKYYCQLLNACLTIGYFPDNWKIATVCPILKPHKPKQDPKSYRPIALTSTMGKLFEKIINARLRNHLENNNILNPNQCGFRAGRSTTDQLLKCTQSIQEKSATHKHLLLTVDMEAAFDKVWHPGLLYKLHKLDLPPGITRLMASYLTNRLLQVKNGEAISQRICIEGSVPQGGVFSTNLFNIYVNDIPHGNVDVQISQFADDVAIWSRAKRLPVAGIRLQQYIHRLDHWCKNWRIILNPAKSTLLNLSQIPNPPQITMRQHNLTYHEETTFLGLRIKRSLTWGAHVKNITQRCENRLNLLKMIRGTDWGASPEIIIHTYKALILPVITYAYAAWCNIPTQHIDKLQVIQNKALRIAYRVRPLDFITNASLHQRANIPSVREVCLHHARNFINTRHTENTNQQLTDIIEAHIADPAIVHTLRRTPLHTLLPNQE